MGNKGPRYDFKSYFCGIGPCESFHEPIDFCTVPWPDYRCCSALKTKTRSACHRWRRYLETFEGMFFISSIFGSKLIGLQDDILNFYTSQVIMSKTAVLSHTSVSTYHFLSFATQPIFCLRVLLKVSLLNLSPRKIFRNQFYLLWRRPS